MKSVILILLVNFSLLSAQTWHIIGGVKTNIQRYPYQISLRLRTNDKHKCGGAIISKKFIITAAHCICLKRTVKDFYVYAGSSTLNERGKNFDIKSGYCNECYSDIERINDIALIKIKTKFIYSKAINFIRIRTGHVPAGTRLLATGWGITKFPKISRPNQLQVAKITVISLKQCRKYFGDRIKETNICTFEKGERKGTCKGDSGGPVAFGNSLVGIVSWGIPCAIGLPDIYTKVSAYIPWIEKTIKLHCKKYEDCLPTIIGNVQEI